jgi:hypothetical protein
MYLTPVIFVVPTLYGTLCERKDDKYVGNGQTLSKLSLASILASTIKAEQIPKSKRGEKKLSFPFVRLEPLTFA